MFRTKKKSFTPEFLKSKGLIVEISDKEIMKASPNKEPATETVKINAIRKSPESKVQKSDLEHIAALKQLPTPKVARKMLPSERKISPSERKILSSERKMSPSERKIMSSERKTLSSEKKMLPSEKKTMSSDNQIDSLTSGQADSKLKPKKFGQQVVQKLELSKNKKLVSKSRKTLRESKRQGMYIPAF